MIEELYSISKIAQILNAKAFLTHPENVIRKLLTDSRTVIDQEGSLFFAVNAQRDGHQFIANAYENGVRNFVISNSTYVEQFKDANFIEVTDVLQALQQLATYNRNIHNLKVIGITGSNGKTIVKEWLYQLLAADFNIVRSPKSFNSQIGVPLSVWQVTAEHNLAIFEAGVSTTGEMANLATIISPSIGVLTNIGEAHASGFESKIEKLTEKLKLFAGSDLFVYAPEYVVGVATKDLPGKTKFSWSLTSPADLKI